MFQFPFGTMHQLNLDWFLQQWQQLRQDWIDEEQHIDESMQDVYDARDVAIQAKDDAVSAKNDAESAQAGVHADALMAEGFAVGEQNGTPVGPGSPYYQVNAKFYSTNAGTYRYLSEAYARGTMGGTPVDPGDAGYEDNAKYYKEQADLDAQSASDDAAFAAADALKAEGYAVGEQNGVPVSSGDPYYQDNCKYYAAEAQQDKDDADAFKDAANQAALRAEGYTSGTQNGTPVSSGSPYYENNAAYFYGQAAGTSGDLAQAMIAGDESSMTLTADYPAGSYIRVAGILYQTDIDLVSGNTLTVGTNCHVAVLGDDLYSLKNDIYKEYYTLTQNDIYRGTWENGSRVSWDKRLCNKNLYPVKKGMKVYCDPGTLYISFAVFTNGADNPVGDTGWINGTAFTYIIPSDGNLRFIIKNSAGTTISLTDYDCTINLYTTITGEIVSLFDQNANIENIIAPVLPEMKADTALIPNNFRIVREKLYRITSNISSGGTLTPGTNCVETTIAAVLTEILNS